MSRRAAAVTQADVERVIRAAKRQGAARVTVRTDGKVAEIAVDLEKPAEFPPLSPPAQVAPRKGRALC
jgi:hypothetical protein